MHDFAPFLPWVGLLLGLLCLWAAFRAGRRRRMIENLPTSKTTGVFIGLVELKGTAVLAWIWMVYNSLVDLRLRVRQAWSLVDIQLKRRHDLIPNLVSLVKGYRGYEQQVQTELAALRREMAATPPGVAGPDYRAVVNTVTAIAERYPDLKADATFAGLHKNLVDTEHRIALARGYFNDIATHYNTRLDIVPERFVARLGAMRPQPLMEANAFERAAVKVDLSGERRAE